MSHWQSHRIARHCYRTLYYKPVPAGSGAREMLEVDCHYEELPELLLITFSVTSSRCKVCPACTYFTSCQLRTLCKLCKLISLCKLCKLKTGGTTTTRLHCGKGPPTPPGGSLSPGARCNVVAGLHMLDGKIFKKPLGSHPAPATCISEGYTNLDEVLEAGKSVPYQNWTGDLRIAHVDMVRFGIMRPTR